LLNLSTAIHPPCAVSNGDRRAGVAGFDLVAVEELRKSGDHSSAARTLNPSFASTAEVSNYAALSVELLFAEVTKPLVD
jgi:hypothetical protein